MNRIECWIDKDLLTRTGANLKFLALILRLPIEWGDLRPVEWDDYKAAGTIQDIEADAERLGWVLGLPDHRPTEDEEITAVKELIEKHGERSHRYGLAGQVRGIVERYQRNEKNAYGVVASLVESFRTDVRAVQMMVKAIQSGGTHRIKNSRAYVALDMIDQIVARLIGIDVDHPRVYDIGWGSQSFDFRRLQAENQAQAAQIGRLTKQVEALSARLREAGRDLGPTEEREDPTEYEIPF